MTKTERLLAVVGVGVVATAILLVVYVRQTNPASAQSANCSGQSSKLGETLDQVRFSTSAEHAVATALNASTRAQAAYFKAVSATQAQINAGRVPVAQAARISNSLHQASWILTSQTQPLAKAQAIINEEQREVASAMPLISQASGELKDEDCSALSLTLAQSGWPKDLLIPQLSQAARINAQVSDSLESALDLILSAQHDVRAYSVAAK